ncbi:MAG: DUF190 domain-containing protein [Nitrososphaera sp.]
MGKAAWRLTIYIKKNDEFQGKRLHKVLLDLLAGARVSCATVWVGVNGFGKSGKSVRYLEGIAINCPIVIEAIEEQSKLELIMPEIKRMVDGNGLMTVTQVDIL